MNNVILTMQVMILKSEIQEDFSVYFQSHSLKTPRETDTRHSCVTFSCYLNHKILKNSTVLKVPVITSGFTLNSLFSYINVTMNFASKTMSTVDSIANKGCVGDGVGFHFVLGFWIWVLFCFFWGLRVCLVCFLTGYLSVSGNNVPKNRGRL